jgi:SAM-dependent methyltransferase
MSFIRQLSGEARRFVRANERTSLALTRKLPQARVDLQKAYADTAATYVSQLPSGAVVLDVGAGRVTPFAAARPGGVKLIGVDVSPEAMENNDALDQRIVGDITAGLPFARGSVDLITSRSVLEHLRDTRAFVAESARVTRAGGYAIHFFPSRFAPFAIANQLLPNRVSRALLESIFPWARDVLGYPAFYDHCYQSAMTQLFEQSGFSVVNVRLSYSQAYYFSFFVPLFAVAALYDEVVGLVGARNLAAGVLLVARRR